MVDMLLIYYRHITKKDITGIIFNVYNNLIITL